MMATKISFLMIYKVKRVYYITILCHLVYSVKVLTTYRVFF